MKKISTTMDIHSTPQLVWNTLTDFDSYSKWNPFIVNIKGKSNMGSQIEIHIKTSKGNVRIYRPFITKLTPYEELHWYGKSVIPGMFNSERIFEIETIEPNRVRFHHNAHFLGLGTLFLGKNFIKEMTNNFNKMNDALKKRVEQNIQ